jgi:transposase InsO family protein
MLLHRRLAHWNEDLLQKMVKHRAVDMVLSDRARCVCDVCRVSKATRRHVADHREHLAEQTRPFQRVWTDLKGKVCRDFFGNQHLVTFTCEVSRWTCIYFAKLKSDVKNRYREFLKWVELQGYKVEQLNSDGGGEYTANENAKVISEFQQISLENGITQNFTAAYTPEMNGISERLNRTIVEHTRALLLEAGLAREFWSLAAKHVVFIRNRLWHRHLQNSINVGASPFQIVYGKAPRLGTLRVWGCDAWKLDHLHQSSSFSRKAKKMIFVGISPNRKGWVLFDPSTRKTTTTYHCTFDEDMANRRCALRDFDLRQHKAGPGATADEHRLAQLERSLYNDDAIIDFDDSVHDSKGHKGHKHHGAEEAYTGPSTPASPHPQDDRSDDSVQKQPIHSQQPPQPEPRPDRQIGGRSDGGSDNQIMIPERRAAIGTPQDLTDDEHDFLKTALDLNLPLVMQQRNPKRQQSESRRRYEKYKTGKSLRDVKKLGAKWEDVIWDFSRGYIDFSPAATSNSHLAALVDAWENRGIDSSPAAYVNSEGIVNTSNPLSFLSFEESIQQDYTPMVFDDMESLTPRAERLLQRAFVNRTLENFAHCCASHILIDEPQTVKEALESPHAAEWKKAMQEEIDTLRRFNTFKLVPRDDALKHGKLVKSKWVFKVKHEADGSVQRFKARLVAKGFTQVPGTDFYETYSPVFSYTSFRTLIAIAVDRDLQLDQWDLKSSFVQQKLDVEHMYMEPPEGYDKLLPDGRRSALHCLQSLYGLKQSSRLLHERLSSFLVKLGFTQLVSDRCVFTKGHGESQVIVATWVDDIIMASARSNDIARLSFDEKIRAEFEMSPWTSGQADWILNMNVTRDWAKGTLHLSLPKAIEKLAERFNLTGKRKPYVPMSPSLKLIKPAADEIVPSSEFDYASAVGGLLYLSLTARPDVAQSVGVLSRFMSCPGQAHVEAAKQVISYLFSTKQYGITYRKGRSGSPHHEATSEPLVQAFVHSRKTSVATDDATGDSRIMGTYCDADLAGDEGTRRSTTGFCMLLSGGLVCWSSKLQDTVALSTAEAETIAATEAVKQLIHLRLFLRELGHEQKEASIVYEDNNAAISLAHGKEQSKRAKHYQLKVHFLNEQYKNGTFAYEKVDTKKQLADAFTKALPRDDFYRYREWMGVTNLPGAGGAATVGATVREASTTEEDEEHQTQIEEK